MRATLLQPRHSPPERPSRLPSLPAIPIENGMLNFTTSSPHRAPYRSTTPPRLEAYKYIAAPPRTLSAHVPAQQQTHHHHPNTTPTPHLPSRQHQGKKMASFVRPLLAALLIVALLRPARSHGFVTDPRGRGGFKCHRNVHPKVLNSNAVTDYCPHCLNAGGVSKVRSHTYAGRWRKYEPMKGNHRGGFGICGDPVGNHDHMKGGKFADPNRGSLVAREYTAGQVANFEFDATANHGGYLEFYLCDVGKNPNQDISFDTFSRDCHYLERVPHGECESGNDRSCGPVDKDFPGRWVLPCRFGPGDQGDQILGGSSGKMAYRIPNVNIEVGVIQMYWLVTNSCKDPDGFMDNYDYPSSWSGCDGDGGTIGGKPRHHQTCEEPGKFPEEFWNCADVKVKGGQARSDYSGTQDRGGGDNTASQDAKDSHDTTDSHATSGGSTSGSTGGNYDFYDAYASGNYKEDGRCARSGGDCNLGETRCCSRSDVCASSGSGSAKCVNRDKVSHHVSASNGGSHHNSGSSHSGSSYAYNGGGNTYHQKVVKEDGNCVRDWKWGCNGKRCCREEMKCHNNQCRW